jgi:hypothetical protein
MQVLSEGAGPLGALLAGALGQSLGLRWTLLIGVLGIMLASLWIFLTPVGSRVRAKVSDEEQRA